MLPLIVVIFIGVFSIATLVILLVAGGKPAQSKNAVAAIELSKPVAKADVHEQFSDFRKNVLLSAVPFINKLLLKLEVAPYLRILLYQASLRWTVGGLLLASAACGVVPFYGVYLRTGSLLLGLAIGTPLAFAPIGLAYYKRGKRFSRFEEVLPEALDLLVSALRVGQSLNSALGLVSRECPAPVSTEFRICFDEQNFGLEMRVALENMTTRVPLQDLRIVTTAILIQKESGGNLAEVLEKCASVIRDRFRLKRQIKVHTAQGRMTGWVLTMLPVGLGIAMYFINPEMMSVLWKRPFGIKLLWGAGVSMTVGTLLIQKIVRLDV
jgi:tight adherence protein B